MGHRVLHLSKKNQIPVKYGRLYNWYAWNSVLFPPENFRIPTATERDSLVTFLGGSSIAGGKLKEAGMEKWEEPNLADNSSGFSANGSGYRSDQGVFLGLRSLCHIAFKYSTTYPTGLHLVNTLISTSNLMVSNAWKPYGLTVRLVRISTTLSEGETGTMTDNNGNEYPTICINGIEWMAANLKQTKYNDGSEIPEITDNTTWANLTTGARCNYNNNEENV